MLIKEEFDYTRKFDSYAEYRRSFFAHNHLVAYICSLFNVTAEELKSKRKFKHYAYARQLLAYALDECTNLTNDEIAEVIGRDRTNVYHCVKKCTQAKDGYNPELNEYIKHYERNRTGLSD